MRRFGPRHRLGTLLAALLLLPGAVACSDGDGGGDTTDNKEDAGKTEADSGGGGADIDENNCVQGYTLIVDFVGGIPGGKKLETIRIDRDLYDVAASKQAFSYGSSHYTHGEISFAVSETLYPEVGTLKPPLEFQLNFGLIKGSAKNPVHVDKVGTYPFGCKAPEIRITFMTESYRSTCSGLSGEIEVTKWGDTTGDEFRGSFKGRVQRYYDKPDKPDPCEADKEKLLCKNPQIYAEVRGFFGFTLPDKD